MDYIMPASGSIAVQYSASDSAEQMAADALNLGKLVYEEKDATDACLDFTRHYGPLGVVPPVHSPLLSERADADNNDLGVAPSASGIFSRSHGEPLERYLDTLRSLYGHYLQTQNPSSDETANQLFSENQLNASGMRYCLTAGEHPQLIWKPDNLLALLKLTYALAITDPESPLKECKKCGKVYSNSHSRSEFCSPRCRNQYNVYKNRAKHRAV